MEKEIWKDIPEYEGYYQVSNKGRVKSLERILIRSNNRPFKVGESILKLPVDRKGYIRISINNSKGKKSVRVHRLVADLFIPNPENKPQVNHIDHDKSNNCVNNLEWCTCGENIRHSVREGRISKRNGEHNNFSKLTRAECIFIIDAYEQFGPKKLGELFNVSRTTLHKIKTGTAWAELDFFRKEKIKVK